MEEDVEEYSEGHRKSVVDMNKIRSQVRVAERGEWKVRVATWNFSGICSQCKQKEVAGVLEKTTYMFVQARSHGKRRNPKCL